MSAGVARQWNGRLGKTDNSRAGVFAAVVRDRVAALAEGELYVPEEWSADAARCRDAGVPGGLEFRTEGGMAPAMIHRLRREGPRFAHVVPDAGYGFCRGCCAPWRAGVKPSWRKCVRIRPSTCPIRRRPCRCRLSVREGEKGEVAAGYLKQRVWLWEGSGQRARCRHLLARREIDGSKLKFCLSDAGPGAGLRRLADMRVARHFVERASGDAKGACGMAGYQVAMDAKSVSGGTGSSRLRIWLSLGIWCTPKSDKALFLPSCFCILT
ncbi:MAG: transposase [Betaproteobacteria bacterium]|nr:transposase [Betaproteobacteria bacterium]